MRFAEENPQGQNRIRGYGPGQVTVNDEVITASLVVTPHRVLRDWARDLDALDQGHMQRLQELEPEVLLIGTGATLRFLSPALTSPFLQRGVGVEVMDTAAACRTYNILMAEGRHVVAALLMI
jgi:uncharacterized protein